MVGDLAALVCTWGRVVSEPVVRDASVDGEALIADLGVRGVWEPQAMALFDVHVVDTDDRSYLSHLPSTMLASAEAEKKRSTVMPVLSIVPPLHHCVFQSMVLWVMRLLVF